MRKTRQYVLWCATTAVCLWAVAHVGGQAPQQSRPQGGAVRQSLNHPNVPLYNNVKQSCWTSRRLPHSVMKLDDAVRKKAALTVAAVAHRDVVERSAECLPR